MTRTLKSLAVRFPLLVGAIVFAVALVSGQLIEREIGALLLEDAASEADEGARQVASMLASSIPATRSRYAETVASAKLPQALADTLRSSDRLREWARQVGDTDIVMMRLVDASGTVRASEARWPAAERVTWAVRAAAERRLSGDSVTIGPIVAIADSVPGFVVAAPLLAADGQHRGWYVELRRVRATGVRDVQRLLRADRLLVGSLEDGAWTDLERVVPAPQAAPPMGAPAVVPGRDGGPVMAAQVSVAGTPWLVRVEESEARILSPLRAFVWRLWAAIVAVGLIGAIASWALGRYVGLRIQAVAAELERTLAPHANAAHDPERGDELRALEQAYADLEQRVAERQRLDAEMLQTQKLEAVGRLAGGIAHDFNNLLTVISNYSELVRARLDPKSPEASDLNEVLQASQTAAGLTRQLLAFSRRRLNDVALLDLNEVVARTDRMLARLIPSNIARALSLADSLPLVRADIVQVEQVLMNLVVNAVDAMPDGGRLTISTESDGRFVCVAVRDTGAGMDDDTKARLFDPFFTTKAPGKGTGLGLATVHGIVTAAGGRIAVESAVGRGTEMRIYLPAVPVEPKSAARPELPVTVARAEPRHVLLVEDDDATRGAFVRLLERGGHRVSAFASAEAALDALAIAAESPPDVVVTDLMLPGINGAEFGAALRERYRDIPLVLMSGYVDIDERIPESMVPRPVILEKPFNAQTFHQAIARAVSSASVG